MTGRRVAVLCLALAVSLLAGCAAAGPPAVRSVAVRDDLQPLFDRYSVRGTFVLDEGPGSPLVVVDRDRAFRRVPPESTFKVAHSIVALETGVVTDPDRQVLPYGGGPQPFPEWEHDMTMREAVAASNAAVFMGLARRIGPAAEQQWLDRLDYGNRTIGDRPDRFWLGGPLEISPVEQTVFLRRLAERSLPASPQAQETVRGLIAQPDVPGLFAKTGWKFYRDPQVGWWVGWVERPGRPPATFALLIDMRGAADAPSRTALGRDLLRATGVLPPAR